MAQILHFSKDSSEHGEPVEYIVLDDMNLTMQEAEDEYELPNYALTITEISADITIMPTNRLLTQSAW